MNPRAKRPRNPWFLALRGPVALGFAYLSLRALFAVLSENDGLLTPGGLPNLGVAALGLLVLALRLGVVFGLPIVLVYRLVRALTPGSTPEAPE